MRQVSAQVLRKRVEGVIAAFEAVNEDQQQCLRHLGFGVTVLYARHAQESVISLSIGGCDSVE